MKNRIGYTLILFCLFSCSEKSPQSHITKAVAVLHPTAGNTVQGVVTFVKESDGIRVTADISGLAPGKHGFHIHKYGDCSGSDGKTAGGHFNPMKMYHGAPDSDIRHVGDMGNIEADENGYAHHEYVDRHLSFKGKSSIIGRGVIVHAKVDDLTSQPTGAAGARVACGVIGVGGE